jgi:hypothetical protein
VVPDRVGRVDPGEGLAISRSRLTVEASSDDEGGEGGPAWQPVQVTPWLPPACGVVVNRHQRDRITVTLRTPGRPWSRGLLELSVVRSPLAGANAFFSVAWSARSARTFRLGRSTVDEFVDRLDITP